MGKTATEIALKNGETIGQVLDRLRAEKRMLLEDIKRLAEDVEVFDDLYCKQFHRAESAEAKLKVAVEALWICKNKADNIFQELQEYPYHHKEQLAAADIFDLAEQALAKIGR